MNNYSILQFLGSFMILSAVSTAQQAGDFNLIPPLDWDYELSASDITTAGEDFPGRYDSPTNQTIGRVEGGPAWWNPNHPNHDKFCNPPQNRCDWVIQVEKVDINWHPDLELFVRRTGSLPNVYDGQTWQEISSAAMDFFNGVGRTDDIQIQYSIRNVSVLMGADEYSTQVFYTIYEP